MQDKRLTKTEDLGLGWFANAYDDGSMTLRNGDKGQRIDLGADSVERLRLCFAQATEEANRRAYQAA